MQAFGIMFHHFRDAVHPDGQGALSADEFDELLHSVGIERILPPQEWFERAQRERLSGDEVCLTFDDNLRCQFDVARPVMRRYGLTAFWFIATGTWSVRPPRLEVYRAFRTRHYAALDDFYRDFENLVTASDEGPRVVARLRRFDPANYLAEFPFYTDADRRFRFIRDEALGPCDYERLMDALMAARGADATELAAGLWMDQDCVHALCREGHWIGLHSHTHPTRLAELSERDQRREYRDNATRLMAVTGRRALVASHPCNSYDARTLRVLRDLGVRMAFRANAALPGGGPLELPRVDHAVLRKELSLCA